MEFPLPLTDIVDPESTFKASLVPETMTFDNAPTFTKSCSPAIVNDEWSEPYRLS